MKKLLLGFLLFSLIFCIVDLKSSYAQEIFTKESLAFGSTGDKVQGSITVIRNTADKYIVQPGDVLSISVYDEPEFEQINVVVRPDGYATVEPFGEIFVEGNDITSLTEDLEERLLYYLKQPEVSINITQFHPATVFLSGAVHKPGMIQQIRQSGLSTTSGRDPVVTTDLTISNVLANAGGVRYDADISSISITRKDGSIKIVNLWRLIKDGDASQDVILKSGDRVHIPKLDTVPLNDESFQELLSSSLYPDVFPVRVIGEVQKGGVYELPSTSPYLNSALALAAGYTIEAQKKNVIVFRKNFDGQMSQINVDPNKIDMVLRPNDLVYVKNRKMLKMVRMADYATRLISPALSIPNGYNSWAEVFNPTRRYRWFN